MVETLTLLITKAVRGRRCVCLLDPKPSPVPFSYLNSQGQQMVAASLCEPIRDIMLSAGGYLGYAVTVEPARIQITDPGLIGGILEDAEIWACPKCWAPVKKPEGAAHPEVIRRSLSNLQAMLESRRAR